MCHQTSDPGLNLTIFSGSTAKGEKTDDFPDPRRCREANGEIGKSSNC